MHVVLRAIVALVVTQSLLAAPTLFSVVQERRRKREREREKRERERRERGAREREWVDTVTDLNQYKPSQEELEQKKLARKSNNKLLAKVTLMMKVIQ